MLTTVPHTHRATGGQDGGATVRREGQRKRNGALLNQCDAGVVGGGGCLLTVSQGAQRGARLACHLTPTLGLATTHHLSRAGAMAATTMRSPCRASYEPRATQYTTHES